MSRPTTSGVVKLTLERQVDDKNLRCVHTLLNTSLCLGGMMDSAWFMILSTAQKLSAILQLSLGATVGLKQHKLRLITK